MLLKRLEKFCKGSLLEVNWDKTKIFPFGIKSELNELDVILMYDQEKVEVKNMYLYLGTLFNVNGKFILAAEKAVEKKNVARFQFFKYIQQFKHRKVTDI